MLGLAAVIIAGSAVAYLMLGTGPAPIKFSLDSWKVEVSDRKTVFSIQYESSRDIFMELRGPTGEEKDLETGSTGAGKVELTMSYSSPEPGTYKLTVAPRDRPAEIILEQEFSFSGAKISFENCTPIWDEHPWSAAPYHLESIQAVLRNDGDLPVFFANDAHDLLVGSPLRVALDGNYTMVTWNSFQVDGTLCSDRYVPLFPGQRASISCNIIDPSEREMWTGARGLSLETGEHALKVEARGSFEGKTPEEVHRVTATYTTTVRLG